MRCFMILAGASKAQCKLCGCWFTNSFMKLQPSGLWMFESTSNKKANNKAAALCRIQTLILQITQGESFGDLVATEDQCWHISLDGKCRALFFTHASFHAIVFPLPANQSSASLHGSSSRVAIPSTSTPETLWAPFSKWGTCRPRLLARLRCSSVPRTSKMSSLSRSLG